MLRGIGGFSQADSVQGSAQDPISLNRFLYAAANPATLIDPDGHAYCGPEGIYCNGGSGSSAASAAPKKQHCSSNLRSIA